MKKNWMRAMAAMIAMMIMTAGTLQAQQGSGDHKGDCQHNQQNEVNGPFGNYHQIPGLTDTQKEEIKALRLAMIKDINALKDQINEKEASLRTLTRAEKPDSKAIDNLIDEISVLQASKRKRIESTRQQIRVKLNDEQKLWFDQHCQVHHQKMQSHPAKGQQPMKRQQPSRK
ncbi:MAG: periplasmic heavy metal sensor [Bacteroidales bacterium]